MVCDEIGGREDCEALLSSANTGVKIIASVHGTKISEIRKRRYLDEVIGNGIFEYFVTLGTGKYIGKVIEFERNENV